jgi:proline iminopeptidase
MTANLPAPSQFKPPPIMSKKDATLSSVWRRQRDLPLGAGQCMGWHVGGNPEGEPWLVLHGGPGSGAHPGLFAPLDLSRQFGVAPDQRGSGRSRPRGGTRRNHTPALVEDLELLRRQLGLARWSVLGGSWGTVLALAYAQAYPHRIERLVLRGAFALTRREIGGLLQKARGSVKTMMPAPAQWPREPGTSLPALLGRLRQLLQSGTPVVASLRAARRWALLESHDADRGLRRALLHAAVQQPESASVMRSAWASLRRGTRQRAAVFKRPAGRDDRALQRKYRIQAHYLLHRGFMRPGELDRAVCGLAHSGVPVAWVHGRCDGICPPENSRRWAALGKHRAPGMSTLDLPLSGHLGHEPLMLAALRREVRGT